MLSPRYYADNDSSFAGLTTTGSASVSAIQFMGTGFTFTATTSTAAHVVSTRVGRDATFVVLAAFEDGSRDCYGILELAARQHTPVLAERAKGTYFFIVRTTTADVAACNASTVVPSAISTTYFPEP